MNIVFITPSIGYGGAAKMLTFVANQLYQRGHHISIINLKTTTGEVAQVVDKGISVFDVDGSVSTVKKLDVIKKIRDIGKEQKADLLIGFTFFANLYAVIAGKMLGISSVVCERGDPNRTMGTDLKSKLLLQIINSSGGGVFQTDGAREFYGKGLQKRGMVIPNPIFIKGEIPSVVYENREKTVVSVGRLENSQKRYDVMLQAFKLFNEQHPEYILKLYGDGPDEAAIRQWSEELGIADRIRMMGRTGQPMQDIAHDGMFLITSDYEGISNSLLEAMALGLPCVSTDHTPGGASLLIQHGENGLLAPIGDADALAAAMERFASDRDLVKKCGENAKQVIDRFSVKCIIDQWENYCERIARR